MKKWYSILVYVLVLAAFSHTPGSAKVQKQKTMMKIGNEVVSLESGQIFVQAQELLTNKQYDQAADLLKSFLKKEPKSVAAHYKYAYVLLQQEKNSEALEEAKQCVQLAPTFSDGWALLGEACLNLQLIDQAKDAYQKALAIQAAGENAEIIKERLSELATPSAPSTPTSENSEENRNTMRLNQSLALCDKAMEHLKQKQFEAGLQECRDALKLSPGANQIKENMVVYLNNYAAACIQNEDLKQAEALMKEAISFQEQGGITTQSRLTTLKNYSALLKYLNRAEEANKIDAQMKSIGG